MYTPINPVCMSFSIYASGYLEVFEHFFPQREAWDSGVAARATIGAACLKDVGGFGGLFFFVLNSKGVVFGPSLLHVGFGVIEDLGLFCLI